MERVTNSHERYQYQKVFSALLVVFEFGLEATVFFVAAIELTSVVALADPVVSAEHLVT